LDKRAGFVFNHENVQFLRYLLKKEADLNVRTYGMICLDQCIEWAHSRPQETLRETLQDWLFKPFTSPPGAADRYEVNSAVVAVCDEQHIRDVHPLVMLARYLPADRYRSTEFHQVALHDPNWEPVALDTLGAVCFVGRPSMFHNRPNAGPLLHCAAQEDNERTDYAVVQRFRVNYGGKQVVVIILAGGTSLGTVGAAEWVTKRRLDSRTCRDVERATGVDVDDSVRMEVLLEVTAPVHKPAQPWRPHSLVRKMFFNGSTNLISQGPLTVTLSSEDPSAVRHVLFDEDEVKLAGDEQAALAALCLKCRREGKNELNIADLLQDSYFWPNGKGRLEGMTETEAAEFFRYHLKRYRLRESLTVGAKPPILRIHFEVKIQHL
jgi:hypothetical protein